MREKRIGDRIKTVLYRVTSSDPERAIVPAFSQDERNDSSLPMTVAGRLALAEARGELRSEANPHGVDPDNLRRELFLIATPVNLAGMLTKMGVAVPLCAPGKENGIE